MKLEEHSLDNVAKVFREEGISGEVLNMLDEEQLEKIGISKLGDRLKSMRVIRRITGVIDLEEHKKKHEDASVMMFDYLIKKHNLKGEFKKYDLVDQDIKFIKEQIAGPKQNGERAVENEEHSSGIKREEKHSSQQKGMVLMLIDGITLPGIVMEAETLYGMFQIRATLHRRAYQHRVCDAIEAISVDLNKFNLKPFKIANVSFCQSVCQHTCNEKSSKIKTEIMSYIPPKMEGELLSDDLYADLVYLDYGSKSKNPMSNVRFYNNEMLQNQFVLKKNQVSLMLPTVFAEQIIRLYCKKNDNKSLMMASECFKKWCRDNNHLLQLHSFLGILDINFWPCLFVFYLQDLEQVNSWKNGEDEDAYFEFYFFGENLQWKLTVNYVSPLMDEMQRALVAVLNTSDISKNILENLEKQLTTRVKQIVEDTVGDIIRQQIDAKFKEIGIANDTAKRRLCFGKLYFIQMKVIALLATMAWVFLPLTMTMMYRIITMPKNGMEDGGTVQMK
ncbi:SAMHD1 [Mytilus edulis]|uniref:SAMHD1 n=1 Tax=Mytilus edulis TaxID=6550 RepID=A0A8S3V262_MYTED|nr:SAMHD1 [Mytilus edulis]